MSKSNFKYENYTEMGKKGDIVNFYRVVAEQGYLDAEKFVKDDNALKNFAAGLGEGKQIDILKQLYTEQVEARRGSHFGNQIIQFALLGAIKAQSQELFNAIKNMVNSPEEANRIEKTLRATLTSKEATSLLEKFDTAHANNYIEAMKALLENKEFLSRQHKPAGIPSFNKILTSNDTPLEKYTQLRAEGKKFNESKPSLFKARTPETQDFYKAVAEGDVNQLNQFNAKPTVANNSPKQKND